MRKTIIFLMGMLLSGNVLAGLASKVNSMLGSGQSIALYKSPETGLAIISIGWGSHKKQNIAIDIAKQEANKALLSYLKGESISAIDQSEVSYIGDQVSENYYSKMRSDVQGALKSAYMYKSGNHNGAKYTVVVISENSKNISHVFSDMENSNLIRSRGYASMSNGTSKARRLALEQALRGAVEQYSGVQMASKTSIENSEKYHSGLSAVSKGVIKQYKVVSETQEDRNYMIEISAEVVESLDNTAPTIDAVKENMGRPSFYLDVSDDRLKDLFEQVLSLNDLDLTSDKTSARFIVTSKVDKIENPIPSMPDMIGLRTAITIKVTDIFNNQAVVVVENDPANTIEVSSIKSIRERRSYGFAIEDIKDEFSKSINKYFSKSFQQGQKVLVELLNINRMRDVNELKECMNSLPLTKSVSVGQVKNGAVTYEMIYLGSPRDLQMDIMKKSREFRLRGLRVKNSSENSIITFKL